jgi:hypothetical protein
MGEGGSKCLIDLNAQDTVIFRRMAEELGIPKSVLMRWALRFYSLHGPHFATADEMRARLLEGFEELTTGLGIREQTGWHASENNTRTTLPSRRRRPTSKE